MNSDIIFCIFLLEYVFKFQYKKHELLLMLANLVVRDIFQFRVGNN